MAPAQIISHYLWSSILLMCAVAIYRKARTTGIDMLEPFWKFFAVWAFLYFGPLAVGLHIGWVLEHELILSLSYVLPHLFAFVAISYLWRAQSSIVFPSLQKYDKLFILYGILLTIYGLYELPSVMLEYGTITFATGSTYSLLIPLGMTVAAVAIAGSSFYSAYIVKGTSRIKLVLIGVGTIIALVISSFLHNLGNPLLGELANLVWIACFMAVSYWNDIASLG